MASIGIAHLNSYLQPHHSPMASTVPTLTYSEAEELYASNYPCPPGYAVPAGWKLSTGGVPVPPVPQGLARRAAITNHYYLELTPEQRMDPRWNPDYRPTWLADALRVSSFGRVVGVGDGCGVDDDDDDDYVPRQRRQKNCLMAPVRCCWETPRGRYEIVQQQVFPQL